MELLVVDHGCNELLNVDLPVPIDVHFPDEIVEFSLVDIRAVALHEDIHALLKLLLRKNSVPIVIHAFEGLPYFVLFLLGHQLVGDELENRLRKFTLVVENSQVFHNVCV